MGRLLLCGARGGSACSSRLPLHLFLETLTNDHPVDRKILWANAKPALDAPPAIYTMNQTPRFKLLA